MRYRKKPVEVEAVRWDGNLATIEPILTRSRTTEVQQEFLDDALYIPTLEGTMKAEVGDYIICGIRGELYPCKPDIFEATYEAVDCGKEQGNG